MYWCDGDHRDAATAAGLAGRAAAARLGAEAAGPDASTIVEALGVSPGALSQWLKRAHEEGGPQALRRRPAPGPRPRSSAAQQEESLALLRRDAGAYQLRGDVWTAPRIAQVSRQESRVRSEPGRVGWVPRAWGWSVHKPRQHASQRRQAAVGT